MTLLITNARLIDPEAGTLSPGAILIRDGLIAEVFNTPTPEIGTDTVPQDNRRDAGGKCLAPGIVDIGVKICEPGERHKESYGSAGQAAAAGGVTTIVTRPDTNPAIDTPETLEFVRPVPTRRPPCMSCRWRRSPRGATGAK